MKNTTAAPAEIAPESYPELNATLYESSPTDYIRSRLETLLRHLTAPVETTPATILEYGVMRASFDEQEVDEASRLRYAAMESSILLHHAGETLLRLYLAHVDSPKCPWLTIVKLRDFREFKQNISTQFQDPVSHSVRGRIGIVFLGGKTPTDAGVEIEQSAWDDAVTGYCELLSIITSRLLNESNLYNAVKHGLVGIPKESGQMSVGEGAEQVTLLGGPSVLYLHQEPREKGMPRDSDDRWRATTKNIRIESDLMLIDLISKAISSLWAAARRKYCGVQSEVLFLSTDIVWTAAFGPMIATQGLAQSVTYHMPIKRSEDGEMRLQPGRYQLGLLRIGPEILAAYERTSGKPQPVTRVKIEPRPTDFHPQPPSGRYLFPFSPEGYSVV